MSTYGIQYNTYLYKYALFLPIDSSIKILVVLPIVSSIDAHRVYVNNRDPVMYTRMNCFKLARLMRDDSNSV